MNLITLIQGEVKGRCLCNDARTKLLSPVSIGCEETVNRRTGWRESRGGSRREAGPGREGQDSQRADAELELHWAGRKKEEARRGGRFGPYEWRAGPRASASQPMELEGGARSGWGRLGLAGVGRAGRQ